MSETEDSEQFGTGTDQAVMAVNNARGLLSDFEEVDNEVRHGAIKHAISELENARRALPDEF